MLLRLGKSNNLCIVVVIKYLIVYVYLIFLNLLHIIINKIILCSYKAANCSWISIIIKCICIYR